jgi:trypsin
LRRTAFLLFVGLAVAAVSSPPRADAAPRKVQVVGGTPIPVEQVPYQVYLRIGSEMACGGSVLSATVVLTAAHCVVPAGQPAPRPPGTIRVLAGYTNVGQPQSGSQNVGVRSVRVHPFYDEQSKTDDVAVLDLATELSLSGSRIKPIALAPPGGGPAPGAVLGFSGYGAQVEGQLPDGRLYGATLTAISDDRCRPNIVVNASASVQCVAAGVPASCFGDSGGPLTSGGLQVGIASYAPQNGCANGPAGFADVTAPEVRVWIDTAAVPPQAPRQSTPAVLYSVTPPVHGSPMTCEPGAWANAPALAYTFMNDATGQALQSGPSNTFAPAAAHLGAPVVCIVSAANGGGTSNAWTGTTAAVQPDLVPPSAALRSVRCRKRRCTVRLSAADSNSQGALRVRVTAERRVRGRCGKRKRRCVKTGARKLAVKHLEGSSYRAKSKRLARGKVTIRVRVTDAAGNRRKDLKRRVRIR